MGLFVITFGNSSTILQCGPLRLCWFEGSRLLRYISVLSFSNLVSFSLFLCQMVLALLSRKQMIRLLGSLVENTRWPYNYQLTFPPMSLFCFVRSSILLPVTFFFFFHFLNLCLHIFTSFYVKPGLTFTFLLLLFHDIPICSLFSTKISSEPIYYLDTFFFSKVHFSCLPDFSPAFLKV